MDTKISQPGNQRRQLSLFILAGLLFAIPAVFALSAQSQVGAVPQLPGVVIPIPQQPGAQPVPEFIGNPATPDPITGILPVPEHPFMAANGRSNLHVDGYQSDTYTGSGPLGHSPTVNSSFLAAECGTVTFDKKGRINVVCIGLIRPRLHLMDPVTLQTLAIFNLPARGSTTTFGSGGYFFLDQLDRVVVPTRTRDIWRIKQVEGPSGKTRYALDHTCRKDLPDAIPAQQSIQSTLPDANGLLWFTTGGNDQSAALVGTVQPDPKDKNHCIVSTFSFPSDERIVKSFAVDPNPSRGGVFVVTDHKLYRFDAGADAVPMMTWSETYDRGNRIKPGQITQGSGTTPTLIGTDLVTIVDNADPRMHVLVYRRAAQVSGDRLVCAEPVFEPFLGDSFNSLIATSKSISVENNYGNLNLASTVRGNTTVPGITRIDLDADRDSCHTTWFNHTESVPNIVSQLSLATGLEYTYTKPLGPGTTDPWYFTAIDFETGKVVYKRLAGTGVFYNSNYSGLYLGPDGKTAYVGVVGGIVRIADIQ